MLGRKLRSVTKLEHALASRSEFAPEADLRLRERAAELSTVAARMRADRQSRTREFESPSARHETLAERLKAHVRVAAVRRAETPDPETTTTFRM